MCDTNRSSGLSLLRTSPLCVYSESLTIGPLHKQLLQSRRAEYMLQLKSLRQTLGSETNEELLQNGGASDDRLREIRATEQRKIQDFIKESQAKLDQLYVKCEREYLANPVTKEEPDEPTGSDNGDYLAKAVGLPLQKALAEICSKKPFDPIQYLAMWLKNHAQIVQRHKQESIEALQIKLEQEDEKLKTSQRFQRQVEMRNIHTEETRRKEQYFQRQQRSDKLADVTSKRLTSEEVICGDEEEELSGISDQHSERSESRGSHESIQEKNAEENNVANH